MWLKNVSKVAPIKEAFKCFLSFIFAAVEPGRSSSSSRFFASTVFRNSSVEVKQCARVRKSERI